MAFTVEFMRNMQRNNSRRKPTTPRSQVRSALRWTEEDYAEFVRQYQRGVTERQRELARQAYTPISAPNLEPNAGDGAAPKNQGKKVDQKFRIHLHSRRRRAIDPDGLYSKAAIDGLTEGGILPDDNANVVTSVSYSQERAKTEETI